MSDIQPLLDRLRSGNVSLSESFDMLQEIDQELVRIRRKMEEKPTGFIALILFSIFRFFQNLFGAGPKAQIKKVRSGLLEVFTRPFVDPLKETQPYPWRGSEEYRYINARITQILLQYGDRSTVDAMIQYLSEPREQGSTFDLNGFIATQVLRYDDLTVLDRLFAILDDRDKFPHVVRNLNLLELPAPPVHQEVNIPALNASVNLRFSSLKEEITLIRDLSNGLIQVNADVWTEIDRVEEQIVRGTIDYDDWFLALILTSELNHFELEYFVENGKVTICTLASAVLRWKDWFRRNRSRLRFSEAERKYVLV